MSTRLSAFLSAGIAIAACSRPAPAPPQATEVASPPASAAAADVPTFANRVWKVSRSSGVAAGTFYVFLSDSTLLITSSNSTPALGRWRYAGDTLTLIEEGIPHAASVVRLSADELAIRLAGRGDPLDINFVPAAAP